MSLVETRARGRFLCFDVQCSMKWNFLSDQAWNNINQLKLKESKKLVTFYIIYCFIVNLKVRWS